MDTFAGTARRRDGRRHRHGPRAGPPAQRRGLPRRHVRRVGRQHRRDGRAAVATARPAGTRVDVRRRRLRRGAAASRSATTSSRPTRTDHVHLLFNNAGIGGGGSFVARRARRVGAGVRRLLGRRLPRHPDVPADAAGRRRGPRRQHQQRQRLLGARSAAERPHRLQRGQVRGEGVHRGADHRLPPERPAPQGVGGDARPHRHVDRVQLRRVLRTPPEGADARAHRPGPRAVRRRGPRRVGGVATRTSATAW